MKHIAIAVSLLALAISIVGYFRSAPPADAFATAAITNASAGVFAECDNSQSTVAIYKQFNNISTKPIQIRSAGEFDAQPCILKFPFKVRDHVIVATSAGVGDTVNVNTSNISLSQKEIEVTLYSSNGFVTNGIFYLVVY